MILLKLNQKVVVFLVCVLIVPLITCMAFFYYRTKSNLKEIELDRAKSNLHSVATFIDFLVQSHESNYTSWTLWTEYYDAVRDKDKEWIEENILTSTKEDTPNEVLASLDNQKEILGAINLPKSWESKIEDLSVFKKMGNNKHYASGIERTSDGLYIVTVVRIVDSDDVDFKDPNGYTIYARKISPKIIEEGKRITRADIVIKLDDGTELSTIKESNVNMFDTIGNSSSNNMQATLKIIGQKMFIRTGQVLTNSDNIPIAALYILSVNEMGVSALNDSLIFSNVIIALIVLLSVGLLIWLRIKLINPIEQASAVTRKVANGDLTTSVESLSQDEIGTLLNHLNTTVQSLSGIVRNIKNSAAEVAKVANNISKGNEDLSARTQSQAVALDRTSSAIEELTATVKQNAENAQKANKMSSATVDILSEGNTVVKETIKAMEEATFSSKKISEIINVVNEIAFQTNLLALNAAVEAARAGEHGRGFAVVAVEVRNLAQRSAESAKEIQTLIKDSVEKTRNGNQLVLKAGEYLNKITESINNMTELISEISAASREQSIGIEEVSRAIVQIDTTTQKNNLLVEESAAASSAMRNESEELLKLVSQFKIKE